MKNLKNFIVITSELNWFGTQKGGLQGAYIYNKISKE